MASLCRSLIDLLPIVVTVALFQLFVFQKSPNHLGDLLIGLSLVIVGLSLFVAGLEMGLFPIGEQMARDFAKKGSVPWLVAFAFALGFGTTFAEPALIAVSNKAAQLMVAPRQKGSSVEDFRSEPVAGISSGLDRLASDRASYAFQLRWVVALAVGAALVLGVFRILRGWPISYLIMGGYGAVMALTPLAPVEIVGIAYDAGGVTTSTITVPLATALGVGLASCIKGRNSLWDGFGLIAFASLTPIIFVLLMGIFSP